VTGSGDEQEGESVTGQGVSPMKAEGARGRVRLRWNVIAPLVIAMAVFAAYSNTFTSPFLFDDANVILANRRAREFLPPWDHIFQPCRFVTDLTFAANYATGRLNPADYHLTNILIHLAAALFLFGAVRRVCLLPKLAGAYGPASLPLAFGVALLWAVHPLQTGSVTYLCQRSESLMGMFYLAALYSLLRSLSCRSRAMWQGLGVVACALGMGTKQVMVTAPVMLLLFDRVFISGSFRKALQERPMFYAGLCATWVVLASLMALEAAAPHAAREMGLEVDRVRYILAQPGAVMRYLRLALIPAGQCLDPAFEPPPVSWGAVAGALPLLFAGAATLWAFFRHPAVGFLGLWFFGILAPTSSVMPLEDVFFEHRAYLPLASASAAFVFGADWLMRKLARGGGPGRRLASRGVALVCLLAPVAAVLVLLSHQRNTVYRSAVTVWQDVLRKRPENLRAYVGLSVGLLGEGRHAEAEACCAELLRRLESVPATTEADIAGIPDGEGRRRALSVTRLHASARNNMGLALYGQGRDADAVPHYLEAIRIYPSHPKTYNNLALAYDRTGRREEAAEMWRQALAVSPGYAKPHFFLGLMAEQEGRHSDAVAHLRSALRGEPGLTPARQHLAWLLAVSSDDALRDGEDAVQLAEEANRATGGQSAEVLDVLAAALAEAGRYDAAVETATAAVALLRRAGADGDRLGQVEARLALYRSGSPFRVLAEAR